MILTAPWVLPITSPAIANGALVIHQGRILAVGPRRIILRTFRKQPHIHLQGHALMPGLVNTHTHLELSALAGLHRHAQGFVGWVLKLIASKRRLPATAQRSAMALAVQTLLTTGTTTVAEVATTLQSAKELVSSGLRARFYIEFIGLTQRDGMENLAKATGNLQKLRNIFGSTDCFSYGFAPHAPYSVNEKVLEVVAYNSLIGNIGLSMHLLENKEENLGKLINETRFKEYFKAVGWGRISVPYAPNKLMEYLDGLGLLSPRLLAVHAVHVKPRDLLLLARRNVAVCHCPRSNANLRVGTAPLPHMLQAGLRVGLGTDSLASTDSLSLWDEIRAAQGTHLGLLTPKQWLAMATMGGAMALGLEKQIGSLEPGKCADIIAAPVDSRRPPYAKILKTTQKVGLTLVDGRVLHSPACPGLQGKWL